MKEIKPYNDIADKKEYQQILSDFIEDTSKKYGISQDIIRDALKTADTGLYIKLEDHVCFVFLDYVLDFSLAIMGNLFRDIQNISPKQKTGIN